MEATEPPVPDFITQTDKYGNATTPRPAISANPTDPTVSTQLLDCQSGDNHQPQELADVCTETLLDSVRLMCCCLLPEDGPSTTTKALKQQEAVVPCKRQLGILPKLHPEDVGKKCLVLDLDETLVHSSFRAVPGADFVIPVQVRYSCLGWHVMLTISLFAKIEDVVHFVYVAKRPGVDEFLTEMAKHYELVIYTASLNKYADPLLDLLDPKGVIRSRLFRESCVYHEGNYVKDLSKLDRDLRQTIIIDNSPNSYSFQPENAIDCSSFIDDPRDRELNQIAAFLTGIKDVRDVRGICRKWREWPDVNVPDAQ